MPDLLRTFHQGPHCMARVLAGLIVRVTGIGVIVLTLNSACASGDGTLSSVPSYVPAGYKLVWSDEFNAAELDSSKWAPRGLGPRRGGVIDPDCAFVDGEGHLVIETRKIGSEYHSGMIGTQNSFQIRYGYLEARIKFPTQGGQNSGFWLQSAGNTRGEGPPESAGVEVDIIEFHRGRLGGRASNVLHWGGYGDNHQKNGHRFLFSDHNDWHTFGLLWTRTGYIFYADGKQTWQTSQAVSHVAEYMILSTAVGNRRDAIERASLPDRFMIDYVRVYAQADSAVGGDKH